MDASPNSSNQWGFRSDTAEGKLVLNINREILDNKVSYMETEHTERTYRFAFDW